MFADLLEGQRPVEVTRAVHQLSIEELRRIEMELQQCEQSKPAPEACFSCFSGELFLVRSKLTSPLPLLLVNDRTRTLATLQGGHA